MKVCALLRMCASVADGMRVFQDVNAILARLVVSPCFRIDPDLFDALASVKAEGEEVHPDIPHQV